MVYLVINFVGGADIIVGVVSTGPSPVSGVTRCIAQCTV